MVAPASPTRPRLTDTGPRDQALQSSHQPAFSFGQVGTGSGERATSLRCTIGRPHGWSAGELMGAALREHSPPRWTTLKNAGHNGPGRLPRSPRLRDTGVNTTTHAHTHMTHRWGHMAVPCRALGSLPMAQPSSPVCRLEPLSKQAPESHPGAPAYRPDTPQVAPICAHAPSVTPPPQAPEFSPEHTLPSPQAGGGHRPPTCISKTLRHLSQGIPFMDNGTPSSQELGAQSS